VIVIFSTPIEHSHSEEIIHRWDRGSDDTVHTQLLYQRSKVRRCGGHRLYPTWWVRPPTPLLWI